MATTSKTYLDYEGLRILVGKIKNHIKVEADTKIQKIEYDSNSNQLKWSKNGKDFIEGIDVGAWVRDIYLNSVELTSSANDSKNHMLKLKLKGGGETSINLKEWFDPNLYLTTSSAEGTYLRKDAAEGTYLTISSATNHYVTEIATLTAANIEAAWNNPIT